MLNHIFIVLLRVYTGWLFKIFFYTYALHIVDVITFRCWQVNHWRTNNVSIFFSYIIELTQLNEFWELSTFIKYKGDKTDHPKLRKINNKMTLPVEKAVVIFAM